MAKDAFYFSHDSNARNDEKMLQLRAVYKSEGYGWYWIIIEMMRDANAYRLHYDSKYFFKAIAEELKCDEQIALSFISDCIDEFDLFKLDDGYLYSYSFLRRMALVDEKREKASASAKIRWERNATAMRSHSDGNAKKKRKVKKSKEDKKEEINGDPQETFYESLISYVPTYGADMVRSFYDYWSEYDPQRTKMRHQMEKTWEVNKRLATWSRRSKDKNGGLFGSNSSKPVQPITKPSLGKNLESIGITNE